jgi:thiamine biosynthesis protein ThiS
MNILLNGESRPIEGGATIAELLSSLNLEPKRLAVELNERVVPRTEFGAVRLQAGDRVEIVTLVGGG